MGYEGCQDCPPLKVSKLRKGCSSWDKTYLATLADIDPAEERRPDSLMTDGGVTLIYAKADEIRECKNCKAYFTKALGVPEFWWLESTRRSNGYFGCEESVDGDGNLTALNTWFRVILKQMYYLKKTKLEEPSYVWYKFNVFTRWFHSTRETIVIFFDPRDPVKEKIPDLIQQNLEADTQHDPYWIYSILMEETARLHDQAVWSVRDLTRESEKTREDSQRVERPEFEALHNTTRHAIHSSECLDVATKTSGDILRYHERYMSDHLENRPKIVKHLSRKIHDRLAFNDHMLHSLRARAASNQERLQNEVSLLFNLVADYDSRVSFQVGSAVQIDSRAMKIIAFVTLAFLPATFTSSVFSTSFFDYGSGDSPNFSTSRSFWIFWTLSIPLTILTWLLVFFVDRITQQDPIGQGISFEKTKTKRTGLRDFARRLTFIARDE